MQYYQSCYWMLQGSSYGTMEVNMGGRGATSNLARLAKYGTEFRQVKTNKNGKRLHISDKRVLFVTSTDPKHNNTPYESMMPNRIYAVINNRTSNLKAVVFTDKHGMAYKFIDVNQIHSKMLGKGDIGHVHEGYFRNTARALITDERHFVQRLLKANGEKITPRT